MLQALSVWESGGLLWIQNTLRTPWLDGAVAWFTHLGDHGLLLIVLTLLLLLCPQTRRLGLATALGLVCSLLFTNLGLKLLFQRPRPWVSYPAILPVVVEPDPNSFPSGHTSAAFAFAAALLPAPTARWGKGMAIALAVLMGASRLYVGVHYPSDVLAGAIVGALAGLAGWWLSKWLLRVIPRRDQHPVE